MHQYRWAYYYYLAKTSKDKQFKTNFGEAMIVMQRFVKFTKINYYFDFIILPKQCYYTHPILIWKFAMIAWRLWWLQHCYMWVPGDSFFIWWHHKICWHAQHSAGGCIVPCGRVTACRWWLREPTGKGGMYNDIRNDLICNEKERKVMQLWWKLDTNIVRPCVRGKWKYYVIISIRQSSLMKIV